MSSAFTEQEKEAIQKALREAAMEFAATAGMRKTSVDELAERAGISKGAFYKFYETKEHLFFEILECWHTELYAAAWKRWQACDGLPPVRRAAETLMEAFRIMEKKSMVSFIEEDIPYLLRKIPAEELSKHYHGDDVHISDLIARTGVSVRVPPDVVSAVVRALFLTLEHRREIGPAFPQVFELLVLGACEQLLA